MAHYDASALNLYYNKLLTDKTYNVYLDEYGYAIGVDLCEGDANYVFITGYQMSTSAIADGSVRANAIFLDGTTKTISVNLKDTNTNIKDVEDDYTDTKAKYGEGGGYFEQWKADTSMTNKQTFSINRWFTYVEKNGEYTLNPATRMFTTETTSAKTIKCNSVRIDADPSITGASAHKNAKVPGDGDDTRKAYGNDDSVFIIAELDKVSADGATNKVITGVDGIYTGVQNVEIDVYCKTTADDVSTNHPLLEGFGTGTPTSLHDSIYTLFDSDYYIIGTVIIGEAKGSDANLVYVKSAATLERKVDDTYYWEFEAVVDGTIQTLTVKDKFGTGIQKLAPGHVQELRYDGEYVVNIKNPGESEFYTKAEYASQPINSESIYDVGHLKATSATVHNECLLTTTDQAHLDIGYESGEARLDENSASNLHLEGRTLYLMDDQSDYGLTLAKDAKAVVHQRRDGDWKWEEYDSVKAAIDELGDAKESTEALEYAGRITAVLDSNGVAKWVVFNSDTDVETGHVVTSTDIEVEVRNGKITVTNWDGADVEEAADAIEDALLAAKYYDVLITIEKGGIVKVTAKKNNRTTDFTLDGDIAPAKAQLIGQLQGILSDIADLPNADMEIVSPTEANISAASASDLSSILAAGGTGLFNTLRSVEGFKEATFKYDGGALSGKLTPDRHDADNATLMSSIGGIVLADGKALVITVKTATETVDYTVNFKIGA